MRRIERLITAIRTPTDNETAVTDQSGISDDEITSILNDAQSYLQQELETINDEPFVRETTLNTVAGTEAVQLPARTYLGQNIKMVEYSPTGAVVSFRRLRQITLFERQAIAGGGQPQYYMTRNKQLLLSPIPSASVTGGIRLNFVQQLPTLSKRRAKIASRTIVAGALTALTLDITDYATYFPGASAFSSTSILVDDLFSIVDANGTITARNVPITAINGSGVCTLGTYTPESSTETAAVGSYLVAGSNATTHCELPDACEQFLIHWGKWQVLERDGFFQESQSEQARLQKLETSIKGAWNRISNDVHYIPILNSDYLFG